jgi:hypothetical protein
LPQALRINAKGMILSKSDKRRDGAADPIALAAAHFAPRNTDSLEQWCRENLGQYLTPQQRMINESVVQFRYTAVPSCHAAGKSRFSAIKTGHFIDSHAVGSAFVVTTAPTSAQVESVLWRELIRVHAVAGLRGRLTRAGYPQWHIGDELVAFGRRPTEVASFQGIHERFILIVLEEADGIPEALWIAADTLASSGKAHVLAIGNPDSSDSYFAKVVQPGSGWNVIPVDGLRTPNFTKAAVSSVTIELDGKRVPCPELKQYMVDHGISPSDSSVKGYPMQVRAEWRDALLSPEWVAERMHRWGVTRYIDDNGNPQWRESALWLSKVRGRTPTEGSEGLVPLSWVELAIRRWYEWEALGSLTAPGRAIFGCDVADTGKDETVMSTRHGHVIESLTRVNQQDTETTGARLVGRMEKVANSTSGVDAGGGYGAGVISYIRARHYPVIPYVGSGSAQGMRDETNEFSFTNRRSAAYWHLRELLDPINGPRTLCLPDIEDLKTDLTIPKWKVRTGGVIEVEPKESVVKRLKRSPDCGDCVVMTMWPDASPEAKIHVHNYSQGHDDMEDWAPDPHATADPIGRRRQRLSELGERAKARGSDHVFSYVDSGGELDAW